MPKITHAELVRKSNFFSKGQVDKISEKSQATGLSHSEIIRRAVDYYFEHNPTGLESFRANPIRPNNQPADLP